MLFFVEFSHILKGTYICIHTLQICLKQLIKLIKRWERSRPMTKSNVCLYIILELVYFMPKISKIIIAYNLALLFFEHTPYVLYRNLASNDFCSNAIRQIIYTNLSARRAAQRWVVIILIQSMTLFLLFFVAFFLYLFVFLRNYQ